MRVQKNCRTRAIGYVRKRNREHLRNSFTIRAHGISASPPTGLRTGTDDATCNFLQCQVPRSGFQDHELSAR
jgi:hypothetical protein